MFKKILIKICALIVLYPIMDSMDKKNKLSFKGKLVLYSMKYAKVLLLLGLLTLLIYLNFKC